MQHPVDLYAAILLTVVAVLLGLGMGLMISEVLPDIIQTFKALRWSALRAFPDRPGRREAAGRSSVLLYREILTKQPIVRHSVYQNQCDDDRAYKNSDLVCFAPRPIRTVNPKTWPIKLAITP
jgi:hypothetical protein